MERLGLEPAGERGTWMASPFAAHSRAIRALIQQTRRACPEICAWVENKAAYLALGIHLDGTKDLLGLWIQQTEGAKFCLRSQPPIFPFRESAGSLGSARGGERSGNLFRRGARRDTIRQENGDPWKSESLDWGGWERTW